MSDIRTKDEFYNAAIRELDSGNYPTLSARLRAGDVTITQSLGAISQMLAMLSFQIGVAETEVWVKSRDNMVLADAAMKGIFPFAEPSRYQLHFFNSGTTPLRILPGRRLLDTRSRVWVVIDGGVVNGGGSLEVTAKQVDIVKTTHVVQQGGNFYTIPVNQPNEDVYLCEVEVIHEASGEQFQRSYFYNNIDVGQHCYQLIVDEMRNVKVQFGVDGISGYVPKTGESFIIQASYTVGDVVLQQGSPLSLEYIGAGEEALRIQSGNRVVEGSQPRSIDELRELAKFPFLYDDNAVFLGEFAFLIHKNMTGFLFLSVWNEQQEEAARGANVGNINTLFVSFVNEKYSTDEAKKKISEIIKNADNSYKIKFVPVVEYKIPMTVNLRLPMLYDEAAVMSKIRTWLLGKYGRKSDFAKAKSRINWQQTVKGLRESIFELGDGMSDISVSVVENANRLPETFAYLADDTLVINNSPLMG